MSTDLTPGRYRQFESDGYEATFVAHDVKTEAPVVVHEAPHGERRHWVRSLADATAQVSRDASEEPQFVQIEPVGGRF